MVVRKIPVRPMVADGKRHEILRLTESEGLREKEEREYREREKRLRHVIRSSRDQKSREQGIQPLSQMNGNSQPWECQCC